MPFVLIFLGLLFTVSGVRNTQGDLYDLLKNDFSGQNSFVYWVLAIVGIGSLGYVPALKSFSSWLLALIFTVMLLAEEKRNGAGGFFGNFQNAVKQGLAAQPTPASGLNPSSVGGATSPPFASKGPFESLSDPQSVLNMVTGNDGALIHGIFGNQ